MASLLRPCGIWIVLVFFTVWCAHAQRHFRKRYSMRDISTDTSAEKRLQDKLFKSYSRFARPAPNDTMPVTLGIKLNLNEIISYDYQSSELTLSGTLETRWNDPRLQWIPANNSGIESLIATSAWVPRIVPNNARELAAFNTYSTMTLARVIYDGTVVVRSVGNMKVPCVLELRNFPNDHSNCSVILASPNYHGQELDFDVQDMDTLASLEHLTDLHSEFTVLSLTTVYSSQYYSCCPERYPEVHYTIELKRKPAYYNHVFVVPAFLLLFLTPFLFLLPPTSGEKTTLGGLIILVSVVILSMLDRFLPKGHYDVPAIVQYYCATLVLVTLSIAITTIVSNLGRAGQRRTRIPDIVKRVLLNIVSRYLFVYVEPDQLYQKFDNTIDPNHMSDSDNTAIISQEMTIGQTVVATDNDEQVLKCMRALVKRNERTDAEQDIAHEWTLLAIILDRILFIIFLVIIILCNISILS